MNRSTRIAASLLLVVTVLSLLLVSAGCAATYPRRDPTGERFPTVRGTALDDTPVTIPGDFAGKPTLVFIGFDQNSQFDIDRWLLGLITMKIDVPVYEVPTIPGLIPGLIAGTIDSGMRSGIPKEDWAIVVTVYDDADAITRFVGNETPLPARVVLLDARGDVKFFHDRGYSASTLMRLREAIQLARAGRDAVR